MSDKHQNANTQHQTSRVPFGVGCWDFGIRCKLSSSISVDQYVDLLEKGLESISSLNNLNIQRRSDHIGITKIVSKNEIHNDEETEIFSHHNVWSITFDLFIPFRIQKEVGINYRKSDIKTENFKIYILHDYHNPIVFVELLSADEPFAPSSAMVVVREYLERECQKSSHDLVFSCLGPTPFHADFYIEAGAVQNIDDTFEIQELASRGYSDITFLYHPSLFDTVQDAFKELIFELKNELGLFYEIQRNNSILYDSWDRIGKLVNDLTEHPKRIVRHGQNIRKLSILLAKFEVDRISDEHYIQDNFRKLYGKGLSTYLKNYVKAEIAGRPIFPARPITDLIGFIEGRRLKVLEFLVVLVAAVVAGGIGSLITILINQ